MFSVASRYEIFRWLKAVERGIAIFLERALEGTPINCSELRRVRDIVLKHYPKVPPRRVRQRTEAYLRRKVLNGLRREWEVEKTRGPGLLTRLVLATDVARATNMYSLSKDLLLNGAIAQKADRNALTGGASHAHELVTKAIEAK